MDKEQVKLLRDKLGIDLNGEKIKIFNEYEKIFLEKNSVVNLISKNDAKVFFEKHLFDSLAFNLFVKKIGLKPSSRLLDIGTGGGFPSVPLSILYEDLNVSALDSIRKKINVIEFIKEELKIENLTPICDRAENLQSKNDFNVIAGLKSLASTAKTRRSNLQREEKLFDVVTSRAVAEMDVILKYAMMNLKSGGYFVAYKSKKALDELKNAQNSLKLSGAKVVDIIEYTLPLEEVHERNLIVVRKR